MFYSRKQTKGKQIVTLQILWHQILLDDKEDEGRGFEDVALTPQQFEESPGASGIPRCDSTRMMSQ
jgi:hypothetical protein